MSNAIECHRCAGTGYLSRTEACHRCRGAGEIDSDCLRCGLSLSPDDLYSFGPRENLGVCGECLAREYFGGEAECSLCLGAPVVAAVDGDYLCERCLADSRGKAVA